MYIADLHIHSTVSDGTLTPDGRRIYHQED